MEQKNKNGAMSAFLNGMETVGNKFPDPVFIFMALAVVIILLSALFASMGLSAINPTDQSTIVAQNLLSREYIGRMFSDAVKNFTGFPALGVVLIVMLGIGLAEKSGYFEIVMKYVVLRTPEQIIIPVLIAVAIIGNAFGDAAPVVLPPLAAIVFLSLGHHPIAGMVMVYAATLGAFAANLMLGMSDVLVFAFTEPAAQMIDPNIKLNVAMNYYFIAASTPLLLITVYFVTKKITIPHFGEFALASEHNEHAKEPTKQEVKAMKYANIALLLTLAAILLMIIPENGILRNIETGSILENSPFMNGIGAVISVLFFIPGLVYGYVSGSIKNSSDLSKMMGDSMASMGGFIVIVFFASQMMAYFAWSNLGSIMAIKGSQLLSNASGIGLIAGFVVFTAFINLFMGSASAKWALLGPIFVPMFMLLGYHPGFTQMVYRIGDSITNPITPMVPYLPLLLAMAQKYDKKAGLGTLIAGTLPYSIAIGLVWTIAVIVWYLLGLPVGPNAPISLSSCLILMGA
ncbi:aminobenzoyl-glutamate transport protein AbgT (plasmid) [Peptoclostridium acidaminophilum DSM 3953]|uniref:Aminobenzoyl-glutamate transport protein AbgT n=2 Tax=Peptoclostridium acidaminophilum TaxID=1731 RepID=W8TPB4_PEPAC|nr:AbgT family transporter [Peptoclostridium acidaminophilum]AHM57982.1 aminobenzoyl-glutamate transport protein AbgT [Peptoclostridium acidaminophilum DSM 3953]